MLDFTGSTAPGGHIFPIGNPVIVTRYGIVQPWGHAVIIRHDRNRTYRLRFENDTFVTVHEDEIMMA